MGKLFKSLLIGILLFACALQVSAETGVITVFVPPGSEVTLYRVGDIRDGEILLDDPFAASHITVSHTHSPSAACRLAEFAREKELPGCTKQADEAGKVLFADLCEGVYLVVQTEPADGFAPFLFSIPESDIYAVEAKPKQQPKPTRPQPEVQIPETGDRAQPLLLPAAGAMLFSILGILLCLIQYKSRRS